MSGIVNKVKETLHKDDTTTGHAHPAGTHTAGTHTGGTHPVGTHPVGTHPVGAHPVGGHNAGTAGGVGSGLTGGTHTTGTHTGAGSGLTGGSHTAGTGSGLTGGHTTHSSSTNAGPHNSNITNKLDPRVDSDADASRNMGLASGNQGYGSTGTTGTHTGTHAGTGLTGTHTGTHAGNTHTSHTGTHGGISSSTNAGPHNANLANKADPRVDSDLDGKGNRHGASTGGVLGASGSHATAGSGTAQNTAGPHNSDLLNKLDPRVDSDRDGSKTYGGNKTHS